MSGTGPLWKEQRRSCTLSGVQIVEKLAHFASEHIPERYGKSLKLALKLTLSQYRSVYAKATGGFGEFELLDDVSDLTDAKFLPGIGRKTRLLTRISTVGGERSSSETLRNVRVWATNFTLKIVPEILYSTIFLSSFFAVRSSSRL